MHYKLKLNITYLQTFLLRWFLGKLGKIKLQCVYTLFFSFLQPVFLTCAFDFSLFFSLSNPPTHTHTHILSLSFSLSIFGWGILFHPKEWNVSAASWSYLRTRLHGFSLYLCSTLNFKEIKKKNLISAGDLSFWV